MTVSSMRELYRVLEARRVALPVHEVCCYPDEPGVLQAFADSVRATLSTVPEERRKMIHILFSAHGLPQSLIDAGDPYLEQVQRTVAGVMALVEDVPHTLAFQSRATGAKWLEPSTQDALTALARQGVRDVAVVPIAFLSEHVETLYELDMLIRDHALKAGIEGYHRVRSPHCAPRLVEALASLVERALAQHAPLCLARPGGRACPRVADPRR
jgi:ferrochelatase